MHGVRHVDVQDVVEVDHVVPSGAICVDRCGIADLDVLAILGEDGDGLSVDELGDSVRLRRTPPPLVVVVLQGTVEVPQGFRREVPYVIVAEKMGHSKYSEMQR